MLRVVVVGSVPIENPSDHAAPANGLNEQPLNARVPLAVCAVHIAGHDEADRVRGVNRRMNSRMCDRANSLGTGAVEVDGSLAHHPIRRKLRPDGDSLLRSWIGRLREVPVREDAVAARISWTVRLRWRTGRPACLEAQRCARAGARATRERYDCGG